MQGVSGGKAVDRSDQCPGCSYFSHSVSEYIVDDSVQALEGRGYSFNTLYQRVSVKYLLVDLHIGDQAFACAYQLGEERHGTIFVRMWRPH